VRAVDAARCQLQIGLLESHNYVEHNGNQLCFATKGENTGTGSSDRAGNRITSTGRAKESVKQANSCHL
jgi:hypothetical protein